MPWHYATRAVAGMLSLLMLLCTDCWAQAILCNLHVPGRAMHRSAHLHVPVHGLMCCTTTSSAPPSAAWIFVRSPMLLLRLTSEAAVQLAGALLANPHLDLALYLHKLMPALLTCLLTKRLGASPWDSHWHVRSLAAGAPWPKVPQPCDRGSQMGPASDQQASCQQFCRVRAVLLK